MLYSKYFTDIMNEESLKIFSEDPRTINDILKLANHHFSDLVAFRNNKGLLRTFSELNEDVAKTRSYLKQNGINPGDHIGIVLNNDYDFVKLFLAIATMGCVAVLIPVQMPKNNIVDVGQFTNCKMIIDSSSLPILLDDSTTPEINTKPNDDAVIIFTGGTINKPKAVLLTHGNLSRGAMNGCYGFKNSLRRVYYDFIPFTHVFGLVRNLLTGIASGSEQFLCIDMNDFITDLRICKPTILALVPALAELV
jgi:long-chain acyl-CoA synthetase